MKKNKMMRLASGLLIAVLLTTCAIAGTFAKYTTSATSQDAARVAKWGFDNAASINITDLFKESYSNVQSSGAVGDISDVIAPGTGNSATFKFTYDETNVAAPEVAYNFTVSVDGSVCDPTIASNPNIKWKLDNGEWSDWGTLLNSIKLLSGDASGSKEYAPGALPSEFGIGDNEHTITWKWMFDTTDGGVNNDANDTAMGNAATLANVTIKITINATQID